MVRICLRVFLQYIILLIHALWFLFRCNKYGEYPIGHPQIITENFAPLSEYFGLVKCFVLPPRSLYHPVLPYRTQGKLIFPLCRTCVPIPCSKNPIVTTTRTSSPWNVGHPGTSKGSGKGLPAAQNRRGVALP